MFTEGQTVHCLASSNSRRGKADPWTTEKAVVP